MSSPATTCCPARTSRSTAARAAMPLAKANDRAAPCSARSELSHASERPAPGIASTAQGSGGGMPLQRCRIAPSQAAPCSDCEGIVMPVATAIDLAALAAVDFSTCYSLPAGMQKLQHRRQCGSIACRGR